MTKKKVIKKRTTHGAVLVNLTINQFGNEKADKKIVQEVAQTHNASFSQDRYLKRLIPPAVLQSIKSQIGTIRTYHYRVTAPWFDRGIRMMAASFIIDYQQEINRLIKELHSYIDGVSNQLEFQEAEAIRTRGSLFEHGDIPTAEEFKKAYNVKVELLPISMENDFRVDYISNKAKKEFTANNKLRFIQHTQHLIDLVIIPLKRMETSMLNLERAPKIHGTSIDAINWWCDNINSILVDRSKESLFNQLAKRIQTEITSGYDSDGKPKYNPDAIEGALDCIKYVTKEMECIPD